MTQYHVRVFDGLARHTDAEFLDYVAMVTHTLDAINNGAATVIINYVSVEGHHSLIKRFTRKPGILRHAYNWAAVNHTNLFSRYRPTFGEWTYADIHGVNAAKALANLMSDEF